ncbi:MAG: Coenzyme F420 hydrogenase/dehydrogenase, beta subunit C-terminal domain [Kiritimatiellales bacterium]|nr:Coenzyme F420 hydrogenase/dehydrogenase, beta subunit C-terminal domain [Kiritimatiellales bacterium]
MKKNSFNIYQVREHWDSVSEIYDSVNKGLNWAHSERFTTMQKFFPAGENLKVLNVWSRTGSAVKYIREKCPTAEIENLEVSAKFIDIAKNRFPQESFDQTDLHNLSCETESKDVIVSLETLEHVPDPLHFLLECHRVLKVGGKLILSCPPAWSELPLQIYEKFFDNHGEGPHRFMTVKEVLKAMRDCEFKVIHHRGTVFLPVGPAWLKKFVEKVHLGLLRHIGFNRMGIRHFFIAEKTASRDPVWAKIQEEILKPNLCMHSGTSIGLSKGTLKLSDPDGECIPTKTGTGPVPEICYSASPEISPGEMYTGSLLGEYKRIAIANHTDQTIRSNAASGGILTGALIHLLETGKINGAVVLKMDKEHPWRSVATIARTKEEILESAQSKYTVTPTNVILSELENESGPLAYVGLPHQVLSIRRLQKLNHPSVASIKYIFGPFYGNELYGSSIKSFLRKFGAKKQDVVSLNFRAGDWPGHMEVTLKNGKVISMPKFHANYLIPFHITKSSLISHDLTNELTDLSGGDAWAPVYEERGKGFSLLITRTALGDELIKEMANQGKLELKDITEGEAIQMQSHGLDFKKRGSFLRIQNMKRCGKRVPEINLSMPPVTFKRRVFEHLLDSIFWVCSKSPSRFLADITPNWILGPMFQSARKLWKASTKSIKRSRLK